MPTVVQRSFLVTAVSTSIFRDSLDMLRRGGTCSIVGLPPGEFKTPIFDVVIKGLTIRGPIVGTRMDLNECLDFAAADMVKPTIELQPLSAINQTFDRLKQGQINGRVVLDM